MEIQAREFDILYCNALNATDVYHNNSRSRNKKVGVFLFIMSADQLL